MSEPQTLGCRAFQLTIIYALLIATALFLLFPLLYGLAISFMTADEITVYPRLRN